MITALQQFLTDESGVEAIEYGIIAALIFLVIVGAVTLFASNSTAMFTLIASNMPT